MSIKNFFHNLFGVDKNKDNTAYRQYQEEDLFSKEDYLPSFDTINTHDVCEPCGGFFKPGSLKLVTEISVVGEHDGPIACFNDIKKYCDRCKPDATLIINQMDDKNKHVIDSKNFKFEKYNIQEIFGDGSEVVSVSMEESEVIWCQVCGETNTPTICAGCKKAKEKKKNG